MTSSKIKLESVCWLGRLSRSNGILFWEMKQDETKQPLLQAESKIRKLKYFHFTPRFNFIGKNLCIIKISKFVWCWISNDHLDITYTLFLLSMNSHGCIVGFRIQQHHPFVLFYLPEVHLILLLFPEPLDSDFLGQFFPLHLHKLNNSCQTVWILEMPEEEFRL